MVKEIVRDTLFLSQPSEKADKSDIQTAKDLLETLKANEQRCVGMAANMIGVRKQIIAVNCSGRYIVMINPVITGHSKAEYETEEGCLSLDGVRPVKRYNSISVEYLDMNMKKKKGSFSDFDAEVIQHEIDHFSGKLI